MLAFQRSTIWSWIVGLVLLALSAGAFAADSPNKVGLATSASNEKLAEPISKGLRVFSCGHSFHVWVPAIVADLCKLAGISGHEQIGLSSIGGSQVIRHWDIVPEKNKAKDALRSGKVEVLTLSPIFLPDAGVENFTTLALEHNKDIRVIVQPIWLRWDIYEPTTKRPAKVDHNAITGEELRKRHAEHFRKIDQHIRDLNQKYGKTVLNIAPAPQAVIALREKIIAGLAPGLKTQEDLFTDPLGHGKPPLQALVAYCNYAVIYRRSPVGLPVPAILKQAKLGDQEEKLNRMLQELAWEAVLEHPLSGVRAQTNEQPVKGTAKDPGLDLEAVAKQLKWSEPTEPLKVVGPIHFVGTKGLSVWLITTSQGHILLNSGMPGSGPMIEAAIRKLGFKPEDVKLLLTCHAHVDHVGGHAYLKKLTGAKVVMLNAEVDLLRSGGKSDFHYSATPAFAFEPVKTDRIIGDGEEVKLGDVTLTAMHTPGHTRGSVTWVANVTDSGKSYKIVFPDGTSVNPGYRVAKDPSYPDIASDYQRTFQILAALKPDIWLRPHTDTLNLEERRTRSAKDGAQAWVDPAGYQKWVEAQHAKFKAAAAGETGSPATPKPATCR